MSLTHKDSRNVRAINAAIHENYLGKGHAVYGISMKPEEWTIRIYKARMHKGQLQGRSLSTGKWFDMFEAM